MRPKATIIVGHGINCDYELAQAFQYAGADAQRVHLNDLLSGKESLDGVHIIGLPGGFSFADDCGGGNIFAKMISFNEGLRHGFVSHLERGGLMFGTCNGNQTGSYMNMIPANRDHFSEPEAAYAFNESARYEDRGNIHLKVVSEKSHWLKSMEGAVLNDIPIGHGEGNFRTDPKTLQEYYERGYVALKYVYDDGSPAEGIYPVNPNGSIDDIAGLASEQVLLLMPHPERTITPYNQHGWTKRKSLMKRKNAQFGRFGPGITIFALGVEYCRENL